LIEGLVFSDDVSSSSDVTYKGSEALTFFQ